MLTFEILHYNIQTNFQKKLNVVLSQFYITIKSMWDKNDGGIFEEFEEQVRENNFNYIKITVDDQQYDYLDGNLFNHV